jgi:hypothetical protein
MRERRALRKWAFGLRKREKTRFRREKSESEILINGFIVARVHYKAEPEVEASLFATGRARAEKPDFR